MLSLALKSSRARTARKAAQSGGDQGAA
jgi:hypothetical protein